MRVIVALGNPYRGDDGVGPRVIDLLRGQEPLRGTIITDDLLCLLDLVNGDVDVVLIDAVRGGGEPGTIHSWDTLPAHDLQRLSSHGMDLEQVLALARILGREPHGVTLLGVVGECFQAGSRLSPAVEVAAHQLAARLAA